ncbi:MAG: hypothetical protein ACPGRC_00700 [Salibacteraceae bacterium]
MNSRPKKKSVLIVVLVMFGLFTQASNGYVSKNHFVAYIVQDGKQLPIDQHVVRVKRAPFDIVIEMQDTEGVFVSGSFHPQTYNQAIRNISPEQLPGFSSVAIYDFWRNPLNEFMIEGVNPNFWFIDSPSKHRFSRYEKVNGSIVAYRTVNHFYDLVKHEKIEITNVEKPLYITFIKFKANNEDYRQEELMRHGFKIIWE